MVPFSRTVSGISIHVLFCLLLFILECEHSKFRQEYCRASASCLVRMSPSLQFHFLSCTQRYPTTYAGTNYQSQYFLHSISYVLYSHHPLPSSFINDILPKILVKMEFILMDILVWLTFS